MPTATPVILPSGRPDRKTVPSLIENPDFIDAAVALGNIVKCNVCGIIVGVGMSVEDAGTRATQDGTGIPVDSGFLCAEHAPKAK